MRKGVNKLVALFMAAFLVVGMMPFTVLADDWESTQDSAAEVSEPDNNGSIEEIEEVEEAEEVEEVEEFEEVTIPEDDIETEIFDAGEEPETGCEDDSLEESPDADAETDGEIDTLSIEYAGEDQDETLFVLTFEESGDYCITVTYGSDAELPEGVQLIASEYDSLSTRYQERCDEAAEFCDLDDEEADLDIRLFNAGLYVSDDEDQMTEVEPAAPVRVEITYFGTDEDKGEADEDSDNENYTVIHFGEETEVIQPWISEDEEGEHIVFDVDGFSDIMVLAANDGDDEIQYVILDIGNINGSYRDDSGNLDRYSGYRPWATITGYNGANYDFYGNGEGTGSLVGYGGFADDWRITAAISADSFEDDELTITLPCDSDLPESDWHDDRATFYIYGAEGDDDAVSVLLPKENSYDYRLVGWINIGTGEYYSVKNGNTAATINADDDNIFYADWEAATYDVGYDDGNVADTVETKDFVTVRMFDYNELFNLYSTEYTLDGTYNSAGSRATTADDIQETWTIGDTFHTEPLGSEQLGSVGSFVFYDGPDARDEEGMLGFPYNRMDQSNGTDGNQSNYQDYQGNRVNISSHLGVTAWDDVFFTDYLFNTNAESDGVLGVDYIGEADQLFQYGDEDDEFAGENGYTGYYYYDSRYNSASYNQSEGRFYVYDSPTEVGDNSYPEGFYPYNYYGDSLDDHDGSVNYFFGMTMEVDFYLPNVAGMKNGNVVSSKDDDGNTVLEDMTFNFSGDDDIWIFVDDELVLDMSGIHNKSYGSIDFCTGAVSLETTDTSGNIVYTDEEINDISGLSAGEHTLRVYYLERGGDASNLIVSFNVAPTWEYALTGATAGMVSVDKVWQDADGNTLQGTDTADCPEVTMGLYETDESGNETLVEMVTGADGNSIFENPVTLSYDPDATYLDPDTGEETASYGWHYAWELLDAEKVAAGDYTVKEITVPDDYTLIDESQSVTEYGYALWTIVGETEIEEWLNAHEDVDTSTGEYPRYPVLLTDASGYDSETVYGKAAYIDAGSGNPSLKSAELTFSVHSEEETTEDPEGIETTVGVYGAVSNIEVSACDPGVIWYLEYAEAPEEWEDLDVFHICNEADGTTYYLAVQYDGQEGSEPELVISTVKDQSVEDGYYDEFYCDELGEVRLYDLMCRLVFDSDGSIGIAAIDQDHYEKDNVKIYTLTTVENAPYCSWMFVNSLQSSQTKTDNPENPENPETPENPENPENPGNPTGTITDKGGTAGGSGESEDGSEVTPTQTGDIDSLGMWFALMFAAIVGMVCVLIPRRRLK